MSEPDQSPKPSRPKTAFTSRPKSAAPNRPPPARSPQKRPQTARLPTNKDFPLLDEIQMKLKSTDFTNSIASPMLILSPRHATKLVGMIDEKLPAPQKSTAYKRYTSVLACSSRLLQQKWDEQTQIKHKEKLKTMKACIDNIHTKPSSHPSQKTSIAKQGTIRGV